MLNVIWEPSRIMDDNSLQDAFLCPPLSLPVYGLDQRSQGQRALSMPLQAALTDAAPALAPVALLAGQTSVGARRVDASSVGAGVRVTAFIDICKITAPPLVIPGNHSTWVGL